MGGGDASEIFTHDSNYILVWQEKEEIASDLAHKYLRLSRRVFKLLNILHLSLDLTPSYFTGGKPGCVQF